MSKCVSFLPFFLPFRHSLSGLSGPFIKNVHTRGGWPKSRHTGFSSEIGTKLRDWAVGQAGGSCYSRAALSSNDSKTLYVRGVEWI